ncbi:MAG: c-type cytochrome [Magnetococcales bacterium]|nr:c-type cytochrome [Magnetococcales bacterium]
MKRFVTAVLLGVLGLYTVSSAHAVGDPKHGTDIFAEECADCHSVLQDKNKKGPSLWGVAGRPSGAIADFDYSSAMRQSGIVWTADKMDAYITQPKQVVAGTRMKYDGLGDAKARADLIAYLTSLH